MCERVIHKLSNVARKDTVVIERGGIIRGGLWERRFSGFRERKLRPLREQLVGVLACVQVSGKLIDKERTLEEEIQLRERAQLQWKQAERTVDDLQMELQSCSQARDDLGKQLKQAQVQTPPSPPNLAGSSPQECQPEEFESQILCVEA